MDEVGIGDAAFVVEEAGLEEVTATVALAVVAEAAAAVVGLAFVTGMAAPVETFAAVVTRAEAPVVGLAFVTGAAAVVSLAVVALPVVTGAGAGTVTGVTGAEGAANP